MGPTVRKLLLAFAFLTLSLLKLHGLWIVRGQSYVLPRWLLFAGALVETTIGIGLLTPAARFAAWGAAAYACGSLVVLAILAAEGLGQAPCGCFGSFDAVLLLRAAVAVALLFLAAAVVLDRCARSRGSGLGRWAASGTGSKTP